MFTDVLVGHERCFNLRCLTFGLVGFGGGKQERAVATMGPPSRTLYDIVPLTKNPTQTQTQTQTQGARVKVKVKVEFACGQEKPCLTFQFY